MLERWSYRIVVIALAICAIPLSAAVAARFFGYGTLVVQGKSMGDAIPIGSLSIGKWVAPDAISVGDVIMIQNSPQAKPYVHRVIELLDGDDGIHVLTKGDANEKPDPEDYLLPDKVLRPVVSIPWLGFLLGLLVTPKIVLLLVVVLPGWVLGTSLFRYLRQPEAEGS